MIRVPFIIGGFAVYLAIKYLGRRVDPMRVRLPDGRRVKLLSSVAILNPSACRLLTFEYLSGLVGPKQEDVRDEALSFLQTVADKPEYARCLEATVTVRLIGEDLKAPAPAGRTLSFQRDDTGATWSHVERVESATGESRDP
jgi:hypothetical protein